jgi:hypothetical protein
MWPVARFLIERNVIMLDDLRGIERLTRLALILIINDQGASF